MTGHPNVRVRFAARALVCAGFVVCALAPVIAAADVLAYTYERQDWDDVYACTPEGKGPTGLTVDGLSFHPTWSPDGTRIAFIRRTSPDGFGSARELWTMRANGSGKALLREWDQQYDGDRVVAQLTLHRGRGLRLEFGRGAHREARRPHRCDDVAVLGHRRLEGARHGVVALGRHACLLYAKRHVCSQLPHERELEDGASRPH